MRISIPAFATRNNSTLGQLPWTPLVIIATMVFVAVFAP
jgi:hypothetical protein